MAKLKIDILYEDDDLVVINKPPDLLTIPDRHEPDRFNLQDFLHQQYERVWTVHRLDRETSGAMVFALNAEAHRNLSMQFEDRSVDKVYLALVDGTPFPREGEIDQPIGPHPTIPGKMAIIRGGKHALTLYRTMELFRQFSLVEANIKTGRTHQIRVHLASIGHPLAVDALYGKRDAFYLSEVKSQYRLGKWEEERPLMTRATLHASWLALDHPGSGERMRFDAALPKDLGAVLQQLRKWGS